MKHDLILKINAQYNQFTKAEKKVADYVLKNPSTVLFMSITDLAEACTVGDTSVFRFCKTMEMCGYQEFKMQLSLSLNSAGNDARSAAVEEKDDMTAMAKKIMQNNVNALTETNALLQPENFEKVMQALLSAENIYFFGVGASMLTAMEGMNRFLRITPRVFAFADGHMQAMGASILTPRDTAVIISYSGSTKDTVHVAKLVQQTGAKIICITRFIKSPLTAYAYATLLCGSNEGPLQGGSTSAKISQLYLIDLLYMEYYRRKYTDSALNNERTSSAVIEKLY
ncbi:MAG: MurR/RpiR family transcriptional regulator [Oscillospiraceae bacterium]|nr:MurR/RpiR family transcriptional regulator [Oscillospiraceae bacterium]